MSMEMRQRQQKIVEHVQKMGIAAHGELAQLFNVSEFTIRRDIDYLARTRLLAKVKGGAQRIETPSQFREARLPHRMQINLAEKEQIAARALEFIQAGDTIFLDGSSTIACLARAMTAVCRDVTVVTNSLLVALELSEASHIRLIGLGGIFDRETFSYVGFSADAPVESINVDKAFFSCAGFDADHGTFENAAFNRNTKRLIATHAGHIFLLIDSRKFGQRALTRVLDIEQINTVITNRMDDQGVIERLHRHGVALVVADRHAGAMAGPQRT
jgi:DeoR family transcriptional regulator, fructose operon transcriptional repressor